MTSSHTAGNSARKDRGRSSNKNRNRIGQLKKDPGELLWKQSHNASFDVDHISTRPITSEVIK